MILLRTATPLLLVIAALVGCARAEAPRPTSLSTVTPPSGWTLAERPLGNIPAKLQFRRPLVSPDARHISYVDERDGKMCVTLDGVPGDPFDAVDFRLRLFSPDGSRLAYQATRADTAVVVVTGLPPRSHREAVLQFAAFSPDGRRFAYPARDEEGWRVYVEGSPGPLLDGPAKPVFSPDSRHVAYLGKVGNKYAIVIDGVAGEEYESADHPVFSTNSAVIAFAARGNDQLNALRIQALSPGNGEGRPAPATGRPRKTIVEMIALAPTDQAKERFAFAAFEESGAKVVTAERTTDSHLRELDDPAYARYVEGQLVASADGQHFGYIAGEADDKMFTVIDGSKGPVQRRVFQLAISKDGMHSAYVAATANGRAVTVVDGVAGKDYEGINGRVVLSQSGRRHAFVAIAGEAQVPVIDGRDGVAYATVQPPVFSPDDAHVAYIATPLKEHPVLVLDGAVVEGYEAFPQGRQPQFDSPSRLRFVAIRGGQVYEVSLTKGRD